MRTLIFTACTVAMVSCNNVTESSSKTTDTAAAANAKDTLAPPASDWVSLFDGNSTSGWHTYGKTTVGAAWKVDGGALHLSVPKEMKDFQNKEGGDIVTNDEYENFDLKLEWKISPKGNSGIIFLVHEDTTQYKYTFNTGPEMQVLDNDGHPDGKIKKHRAGDLYDLISCSKETVKPVGEWNEVEIKLLNGKLGLW